MATMLFNNQGLSRAELWNMSELSNPRKNSRVARETIVALPHELNLDSYKSILTRYANAIVERYGVAVDVAIHAPGRDGDHRNFHAHVYCTTQVIEDGKLGRKAEIEWSDANLKKAGIPKGKAQLLAVKQLWEKCVNQEFYRLGMDERIDHKFEIKGDKIPQVHVGPHGTKLSRHGKGHESDEWQINQAIIAYNNVVSLQQKRTEKMQNQLQTEIQSNTSTPQKTATAYGGLAASQEAAEEALKQVKQRTQEQQKNESEQIEAERWKPAQIDPNKGSVINMFQQDSQGVYRWTKGRNEGAEAFRDTGKAIHSQTTNSWALAAELELAKAKVDAGDWKEIRTFGSEEYRRAVWIQGQTMGIQVEGYKPTKEELARYGQAPAQGLAGDQKSAAEATQNRFQTDQKFQNKFEKNSGTASTPDNSNSSPSRSPKM